MKQIHLRFRHRLLIACMLLSAVFLAICSKSSPLYPMNDWVDVHCFFTMGRSILDGLVPYRDLYEQKGPVLYFIYALISLVSRDSFIGVYLMEVITFGLFLFFSASIAQLYLGDRKVVYLIAAILAAVIPITPAFSHGGSVEELCLFMLAYGLLSILRAIKENRDLTFWEAFWNGIFAAMALWIKFTIVGFYMGLALFVLLYYLFRGLRWKELLRTVGAFLLGVASVSAVVFAYFLVNGAVGDLMTVYFYNNLFLYPTEVEGSRLDLIFKCVDATIKRNPTYSCLVVGGFIGLLLFLQTQWKQLIAVALCFAGLMVGTYWGGRGYVYYGLVLAAFAVFGLIAVVRLVKLPKELTSLRIPKFLPHAALVLCTAALLFYSYHQSPNVYLMGRDKSEMPQYKFAQTIQTVEDATLLNYGFLDGGFYYAADVVPTCRYFCYFNIPVTDMWSSQRAAIEAGAVDFIVTRKTPLENYGPDSSKYVCVDSATYFFDTTEYTYYLYQKK